MKVNVDQCLGQYVDQRVDQRVDQHVDQHVDQCVDQCVFQHVDQRRQEAREAEAVKASHAVAIPSIAEEAIVDKNEGFETLKDEFCSDDTFEEINEERTIEKILVNIGDSKLVLKKEITEEVIGEKLSAISGIETEKILSFKIQDESVHIVIKIKSISKKKFLEAKYPLSVTGWTIDVG